MQDENRNILLVSLLASLVIYSASISILLSQGLYKNAQSEPFHTASLNESWVQYLTIPLFAYILRLVLLIFPMLLQKKWHRITKYGIIFALIPEIFLVHITLDTLKEPACNGFGCGLVNTVLFALIISSIAQAIGMIVGLVVATVSQRP